jgi:ABC-type multidrug transport system fused ATPase/permease subunit
MATQKIIQSIYGFFNFSSAAPLIILFTGAILLFVLVKNLLSIFISRIKARYIFSIGEDLSNRALEGYMTLGYHGFTNADFSKELNRITNQPLVFANNIILPIANVISEGLVFSFIVACIAWYNLKILFFLVLVLLPVGLFYRFIRKKIKRIGNSLKEQYPLSLKYGSQVIEGFIEIKTFGKEAFFKERFRKVSSVLRLTLVKDHVMQATAVRLTEIMAAVIVCALLIYSILSNHSYQQTILLLSIYAGASFRLIPSINRILHASLQIRTHEYLLDELKDLLEIKSELPRSRETALTFNKKVEMRNISFRYPEGPHVFKGMTFTINKGEKIAITGNSGEGKTTLLLVMMGFLKADEGEILIDNTRLIHEGFFRLSSYVSQNPYILDGTIAENIAFGVANEHIDRVKILSLINDLGLAELIQQLPQNIDSPIGEKGTKLSGGQRQRLAIARALYADADVLLLDEITNQVHSSAESEIIKILGSLADKGKAIVIVTHKLTHVNFFDSIYRLENGRLNEVIMQR